MADKSINQLPVSDGLTDDGLLVVYQNDETKSIRGSLIKEFAKEGVGDYYTESDNISIDDGVISVKTTDNAEQNNTLPITSAGVYAQIGNINTLLSTI